MTLRKAVLAGGLGMIAATAIAASQATPLEAPVAEHGVPAAQHVESVLRATYVLPTGRGESLATFLQQNAAAGIDVRLDNDQLTVVAPADVQKALGGFIEKCVSKEPRSARAAPNYIDPNGDFFGSPTLAPPAIQVPSRPNAQPNDGFTPPGADIAPVPNYDDPSTNDFGPSKAVRQRTPEDGFKKP